MPHALLYLVFRGRNTETHGWRNTCGLPEQESGLSETISGAQTCGRTDESRDKMKMFASRFDARQKAPSMEEAQNNQTDKMPQPDEPDA